MSNQKNDDKILELKQQIEKKKAEFRVVKRFSPITNCSIEIDGMRYNIQTLNENQLILMLIKLNMYRLSAKDLNLVQDIFISSYNINDWISDIQDKLSVLNYNTELSKLKAMETKLEKMLSDEKKTELELDEIANMLN